MKQIHTVKVHAIPPMRKPAVSHVETWSTQTHHRAVSLTQDVQTPKPFCLVLLRGFQTRFFDSRERIEAEISDLQRRNQPCMAFAYSAKARRYLVCHLLAEVENMPESYPPAFAWPSAMD